MPLPLIPLLGAGASLLGQGINALSNSANNRRQREWSEHMYGVQRSDALADWQMQNDYNSPAAQMKRFMEAGLNPNLIYGSANNDTATVRSSSPGQYSPNATHIDTGGLSNSLMSIYDTQLKQAQTDNLKQQLETAKQDTLLRAAQISATIAGTAATGVNTERSKFDLNQAQQLSSTVLEKAKAELNKTYADTSFTIDANDRAAAQQANTLQQGVENIFTSRIGRARTQADIDRTRQEIENLKKSGLLQDIDINMRRNGVQPQDPAWWRFLSQLTSGENIMQKAKDLLHNLQKGFGEGFDKFKNNLKNFAPY